MVSPHQPSDEEKLDEFGFGELKKPFFCSSPEPARIRLRGSRSPANCIGKSHFQSLGTHAPPVQFSYRPQTLRFSQDVPQLSESL